MSQELNHDLFATYDDRLMALPDDDELDDDAVDGDDEEDDDEEDEDDDDEDEDDLEDDDDGVEEA